jgi:hypothetical protein
MDYIAPINSDYRISVRIAHPRSGQAPARLIADDRALYAYYEDCPIISVPVLHDHSGPIRNANGW